MNIEYPQRDYELLIQTSKWNIFLKYKQCMAIETIEFLKKSYEERMQDIINLLMEWEFRFYLPKRWYWSNKKYYEVVELRKKEIILEILKDKGEEVINKLTSTLHKKYESLYEDVKTPNSNRKSIFSSNLMSICKKYNISWPKHLLNEYTMEQIERMADWLVFFYNEYTEEGKQCNNKVLQKLSKEEIKDEDIDKIKRFREKMQKK